MDMDEPLDSARIYPNLAFVYGPERARGVCEQLQGVASRYRARTAKTDSAPTSPGAQHAAGQWVTERDVILITYGDSLHEPGQQPLHTLYAFLRAQVQGYINAIHILPFYPYSSDDGFAVVDYYEVNSSLGSWASISAFANSFDLMFDAVINHTSQQCPWFRGYLAADPQYQDYYIAADPEDDYSAVVRPRALPLLTPFATRNGTRHVWTTFSADQVDLNYRNPQVLVAVVELLLFYAAMGARFLRLDAIGFLWKERGTSCIHLEQTHRLIQVMRAVLQAVVPKTLLISETNVPHRENISYFGDGSNEAHLVYQFALPPLTLHAIHTGQASVLSRWAMSLVAPPGTTTFLNFLASHDGIGVRPVEGILGVDEVARMVERVIACGGRISYRDRGDGTQVPYELNINFLDAVSLPADSDELRAQKFLAAEAILLSLAGVPGIYIHSLLGSRSDLAGVAATGQNRAINRQKLALAALERDLQSPGSLRQRVFTGHLQLLAIRREQAAFHPNAAQRVLDLDPRLFAVVRGDRDTVVVAIINVAGEPVHVDISLQDIQELAIPNDPPPKRRPQTCSNRADVIDLLTATRYSAIDGVIGLALAPYQYVWLAPWRRERSDATE